MKWQYYLAALITVVIHSIQANVPFTEQFLQRASYRQGSEYYTSQEYDQYVNVIYDYFGMLRNQHGLYENDAALYLTEDLPDDVISTTKMTVHQFDEKGYPITGVYINKRYLRSKRYAPSIVRDLCRNISHCWQYAQLKRSHGIREPKQFRLQEISTWQRYKVITATYFTSVPLLYPEMVKQIGASSRKEEADADLHFIFNNDTPCLMMRLLEQNRIVPSKEGQAYLPNEAQYKYLYQRCMKEYARNNETLYKQLHAKKEQPQHNTDTDLHQS